LLLPNLRSSPNASLLAKVQACSWRMRRRLTPSGASACTTAQTVESLVSCKQLPVSGARWASPVREEHGGDRVQMRRRLDRSVWILLHDRRRLAGQRRSEQLYADWLAPKAVICCRRSKIRNARLCRFPSDAAYSQRLAYTWLTSGRKLLRGSHTARAPSQVVLRKERATSIGAVQPMASGVPPDRGIRRRVGAHVPEPPLSHSVFGDACGEVRRSGMTQAGQLHGPRAFERCLSVTHIARPNVPAPTEMLLVMLCSILVSTLSSVLLCTMLRHLHKRVRGWRRPPPWVPPRRRRDHPRLLLSDSPRLADHHNISQARHSLAALAHSINGRWAQPQPRPQPQATSPHAVARHGHTKSAPSVLVKGAARQLQHVTNSKRV
jgi:hypothetical protein